MWLDVNQVKANKGNGALVKVSKDTNEEYSEHNLPVTRGFDYPAS
jgi:hypothetical protein